MDEDPILNEAITAEVQVIYDHFHRAPNYKYEHIIGKGFNGVACLILECNGQASPPRRLVVKRATHEDAAESIEDEIAMLKVRTTKAL